MHRQPLTQTPLPRRPYYPDSSVARGFAPIGRTEPTEDVSDPLRGVMTDEEREYAITQAGEALLCAQTKAEQSSCFSDIAARDEARRYFEALIRGRSAAQIHKMELERGLA
jgi:hypothetical protein